MHAGRNNVSLAQQELFATSNPLVHQNTSSHLRLPHCNAYGAAEIILAKYTSRKHRQRPSDTAHYCGRQNLRLCRSDPSRL